MDDIQKQKAAARAKKCLEKNYKHVACNIRNEEYPVWQQYAESKNLSVRAMIIEAVHRAMTEDGFTDFSSSLEEKDEQK